MSDADPFLWAGRGGRGGEAWADLVIQSFQRTVDFLVDVFDHGAPCRIRRAGDVALDVIEQCLIILAIGFERGAKMPHGRTPERGAFGRDTYRTAQMRGGLFMLVEIEKREAGEVFDSSTQQT